jgi:hypothetical protein
MKTRYPNVLTAERKSTVWPYHSMWNSAHMNAANLKLPVKWSATAVLPMTNVLFAVSHQPKTQWVFRCAHLCACVIIVLFVRKLSNANRTN